MEKYIMQLVEDMHNLYRKRKVNKQSSDAIESVKEVIRIIEEEKEISFAQFMGIEQNVFPDQNFLTEKQSALLSKEILHLWKYYEIETAYPEKYPLDKLYPLLIKQLYQKSIFTHVLSLGGIVGVDLCEYDSEKCPFGPEYCQCKQFVE